MELWSKNSKKALIYDKLYLTVFIFAIFFPIRHVFFNKYAYLIGNYSDFTSQMFFLLDIVLILGLFRQVFAYKTRLLRNLLDVKWLIVWLSICFFTTVYFWPITAVYYYFRFLEVIVAYGTLKSLFENGGLKLYFYRIFIAFSSLESLLALYQFTFQKPIGLSKLGEQQIYPFVNGIAKIVIGNGEKLARGYGTFFHPNQLSAFLIVGILFCSLLIYQEKNSKKKLLLGFCLLLNVFGLTVSFSRGAYLALAFSIIVTLLYLVYKRYYLEKRRILLVAGVFVFSLLLSVSLFSKYLIVRGSGLGDAGSDRRLFNNIGLQIIKKYPILGIGFGQSLLNMQNFASDKLESWQIQPIHNYFLLSAAELGIPGALILIWIFLQHLLSLIKQKVGFDSIILSAILIAFLVLMFFDHYFYTLIQTQLLLWTMLALASAKEKSPSKGDLA